MIEILLLTENIEEIFHEYVQEFRTIIRDFYNIK